MKAQTLGDTSSLEFMRGRRILEINPDHPIIKDLNVSLLRRFEPVDRYILVRSFIPTKIQACSLDVKYGMTVNLDEQTVWFNWKAISLKIDRN